MTPIRILLIVVSVVVGAVLAADGTAGAHTGFESSDPADGAVLDQPVETVTLVFTGEAEPTGAGFELLDPSGLVREPVEATSVDGTTWVLRFDPAITGGTVGVRWTVKAPDAHPIDGSFSFEVTAPAPSPSKDVDAPAAARRPGRSGASEAVDVEPTAGDDVVSPAGSDPVEADPAGTNHAVALEAFLDTGDDPGATAERFGLAARVLRLAGTIVGVGALVFAATALRGDHGDVRYVLYWVRRAGVIVVLGAVAELVAQVAVEAGGWSGLRSASAFGSVLGSSFGVAVALRVVGGVGLLVGARLDVGDAAEASDPVLALRERVRVGAGPAHEAPTATTDGLAATEPYVHAGDHAWAPSAASAGAGLGAAALVVAHLFDGHTVIEGGRLLTSVVAAVHVVAGAVWAGGVFMLVAVLWHRHRRGRALRALQLAVRFSVVATLAVVAVGAAGVVLAVIVLDAPSELWSTQWGRFLMLKTVIVASAAAAGGYNHRVLIPLMDDAADEPSLAHRFRTVASVEAAALAAALVTTAFLVAAPS